MQAIGAGMVQGTHHRSASVKLALLEDGLSGSEYSGRVGAVCSSRLCS